MSQHYAWVFLRWFFYVPLIIAGSCCLWATYRKPTSEYTKESYTSFGVALVSWALRWSVHIGIFYTVLFQWVFAHRFFTIPWSAWSVPFIVFFMDGWLYFCHRLSHSVPILWAAHGVHHIGETVSPTLIVRQSFLEGVFGGILNIPLVLLGLSPFGLLICLQFAFMLQVFNHTQINWPKALEKVIMTPKLHRIHHGRTPQHVNRNFAATFTVWDRYFGTFHDDETGILYGVTDGYNSYNPVRIMFHYFREVFLTVWRTRNPIYFFVFPAVAQSEKSQPAQSAEASRVERTDEVVAS